MPTGVKKHLPTGKESFNIVVRDSTDLPLGAKEQGDSILHSDERKHDEKQDIIPKVMDNKNKDLYQFNALPNLA